jgi:hypothetical protein
MRNFDRARDFVSETFIVKYLRTQEDNGSKVLKDDIAESTGRSAYQG